jgi:hypothetical protein
MPMTIINVFSRITVFAFLLIYIYFYFQFLLLDNQFLI